MGASNVALAFARWRHLPDHQFRALVFMALRSLDEPNGKHPARLYFAGRDDLAFGLGLEIPDGDDEKAKSARATAYRIVQYRVAALVKTGAISRTAKAHTGRRQAYLLHLDRVNPAFTHRVNPVFTLFDREGESTASKRVNPAFTPRNHEEPEKYEEPTSGKDTSILTDLEVVGYPQADKNSAYQPAGNDDKTELERQADALWAWVAEHPEAS